MKKNDLDNALKKTLLAEEKSVNDRFSRAEQVLSGESKEKKKPEPKKEAIKVPAVKVLRHGFSAPESDFEALKAIRRRCMTAGIDTSKSEILRAGILTLQALPDNDLRRAVLSVEKLKPGRKT